MNTFDWKDLPSGRARFAGSIRGWDEAGHDTFAVGVSGTEIFGELKEAFAPNRNDFGVSVVSFGYLDRINVAVPFAPGSNSIETIDAGTLAAVKRTIIELIGAGVSANSPAFLKQYPTSRFTGETNFPTGWCSARIVVGAGTLGVPADVADAIAGSAL